MTSRTATDKQDAGQATDTSLDEREWVEQWAATVIQSHWRQSQQRHQATRRDVCCACFRPTTVVGQEQSDASLDTGIPLFCAPCKRNLELGVHLEATSPKPSAFTSPLPKLSFLVQTEAKYQEQLRLLRQQQALLHQKQEELQLRKQVQAETLQLEKQLARQRRKQFKELMARRQVDEARRLEELAPPPVDPQVRTKPRCKSPASVTTPAQTGTPTEASVVIEPTQLRRHRIPAPPNRVAKKEAAASRAAELAEHAAQEHRRKQHIETLKCYAQDLTPLIHGNKPKKLPVPTPPALSSQVGSKKKARPTPKKPSKIIQLAPLAPQRSNQHDPEAFPALRVAIPRQSYETYAPGAISVTEAPTPLTAEIKPVAWMNELMTKDPVLTNAHPSHSLTFAHSKSQLPTLHEVDDRDDPIIPTCPSNGQRVTLTPLVETPPPAASVAYSSERLMSLLQKYNVSVSQTPTSSS